MFGGGALRKLTRETAVVHTKDGQSFRGVVIGVYHDALVLAHTSALLEAGEQALSGETLVPIANVSFVQRSIG